MNPQEIFCPNSACPARGQVGQGNIGVHSRKEARYRCQVCKKTFGARTGMIVHGRQIFCRYLIKKQAPAVT
ncbi:MAG: hypothetical protein KatS3mg057_0726 [Herpetosiphonaceae bacterium]|nr:MAG: hypothetical protein KatS3mg057_0726 [Herpetosiphonaceae bacterium]